MTYKTQSNGIEDEFDALLKNRNISKTREIKKDSKKVTNVRSNIGYLKLLTAVMLIVISALIAAWAVLSAGDKTPVLILVKAVPQGSMIQSNDLSTALISGSSNINDVPASNESSIVGQYASTMLVPGQVLATTDFTDQSPLPANSTLVGIPLKIGQEPIDGLQPGDHVIIVFTPQPGSTPAISNSGVLNSTQGSFDSNTINQITPGSVLDQDSTIVSESIPNPNLNSSYSDEVTVSVPISLGPIVSLAASADQISLDLIGK